MPLSPELLKEIEKLVKRANHGDQNAMAMIEQVRKNAEGGVALAQESHQAIMQCVMGYEKKTSLDIGDDAAQALTALRNPLIPPDELLTILCFLPHALDGILLHAACVILSKGPMWPDDKVAAVQSAVPVQAQGEFSSGLMMIVNPMFGGAGLASGAEVSFGYAGHAIGHARRIKAVRDSGFPPSQINANMGWELDC
jgi:hypothetical protein